MKAAPGPFNSPGPSASPGRRDGPAVILGDSESLFPTSLAREWKARGLDVRLVTSRRRGPKVLPGGVPVIRSQDYQPWITDFLFRRMGPVLRFAERRGERLARERYQRLTGLERAGPGEWLFAQQWRFSYGRARAALAQRPRFVLGHEATTYGLATAWCRGVPKALFPWGSDVFLHPESSVYVERIVRKVLTGVDLIVPSSVTAAEQIRRRFDLPEGKVIAVSWGADLERFRPADPERAAAVRSRLGIAPNAVVLLNARRFKPLWGSSEALEALLRIATRRPEVHAVVFGGRDTEEDVAEARRRVTAAGLQGRFTFFQGDMSLQECADAMSIASVFLSLRRQGDMRSSSVLEGAASGAAPILADTPEYRAMEKEGFQARFVTKVDPDELVSALEELLADPARRAAMAAANRRHLERHEDRTRQMDRLLALCEGLSLDAGHDSPQNAAALRGTDR